MVFFTTKWYFLLPDGIFSLPGGIFYYQMVFFYYQMVFFTVFSHFWLHTLQLWCLLQVRWLISTNLHGTASGDHLQLLEVVIVVTDLFCSSSEGSFSWNTRWTETVENVDNVSLETWLDSEFSNLFDCRQGNI